MKVVAMIPARLASSRLPEKMILDLCGLPVILRTYEAVKATGLFDEVIIVTDSKKIATLTEGHGATTILSKKDHKTGSDRIAEAAESVPADIIINVQGDEPFIDSNSLSALIQCFREDHEELIDLASLMVEIADKTYIDNPNVVKVVTDLTGKALYFSRSAIPFHRDPSPLSRCYKHKGVYAFRRSALLEFPKLIMGPLERAEKIEAIRYLEHGKRLQMIETSVDAPGIDTRADLEDAIANFKKLNT
ncbi:MAG: 3-deoxy-manno-octulosonate cytidylyltransferase [Flavobacteriaceae bacterium]